MSFIKLMETRGSVVHVNPDRIVTMVRLDRTTHCTLVGGQEIIVSETLEEITELTATVFEMDCALGYSELSQLKELFSAYRAGQLTGAR